MINMGILGRAYLWLVGLYITHFGEVFAKFQRWLFVAFIATTALGTPYKFLVDGTPLDDLFDLMIRAALWWVVIATGSTVLWWAGKTLFNLDLWIYYYFWIPYIIPLYGKYLYKNKPEELSLLKMILDSYQFEKKGRLRCPVFIKRAHLSRKNFWPHWEFSIIVITTPGKVEVATAISKSNRTDTRWILIMDLTDQSYGIYNNAGKKFLRNRFDSLESKESMAFLSEKFFNILNPSTENGISVRWGESGENFPLRWASGGSLPIVQYQNRDWAMFFFRDINPIGLNLAIGASETKNEYKDLNTLIGREFSEETVILSGRPYPGAKLSQQKFTLKNFNPVFPEGIAPVFNTKFYNKHRELRLEHDKISIDVLEDENDDGRPIEPLDTPFRVRVIYHKADLLTRQKKYFKNILFSINPSELGIEVIWLCRFRLFDNEYILDGEYDMGRGYLIRQPVVLISVDFLKGEFAREHSLGSKMENSEGKLLPEIPEGEFIIFNNDIELRKCRLIELRSLIERKPAGVNIDNLEYEMKRISKWLDDYDKVFEQTQQGNLKDINLRTLCPVSWKVMELVFKHNIL